MIKILQPFCFVCYDEATTTIRERATMGDFFEALLDGVFKFVLNEKRPIFFRYMVVCAFFVPIEVLLVIIAVNNVINGISEIMDIITLLLPLGWLALFINVMYDMITEYRPQRRSKKS
jgi:hypothetical protein